jgi:hypothetical protein
MRIAGGLIALTVMSGALAPASQVQVSAQKSASDKPMINTSPQYDPNPPFPTLFSKPSAFAQKTVPGMIVASGSAQPFQLDGMVQSQNSTSGTDGPTRSIQARGIDSAVRLRDVDNASFANLFGSSPTAKILVTFTLTVADVVGPSLHSSQAATVTNSFSITGPQVDTSNGKAYEGTLSMRNGPGNGRQSKTGFFETVNVVRGLLNPNPNVFNVNVPLILRKTDRSATNPNELLIRLNPFVRATAKTGGTLLSSGHINLTLTDDFHNYRVAGTDELLADVGHFGISASVQPPLVPEPSTWALFGVCGAVAGASIWRNRRSADRPASADAN